MSTGNTGRIKSRSPRGLSVALALVSALLLCVLTSTASADPPTFSTASGNCSDGQVTFPVQPTAHLDTLIHFQSVGSSGGVSNPAYFGIGDIGWVPLGNVDAGTAPTQYFSCDAGSVSAALADRPNTPATFSGSSTPRNGATNSYLSFRAPGAGQYVVDATIGQGAITIEDVSGIIQSSGEHSLGSLSAGNQDLSIVAQNGPPAKWTLTVRELPVAVNGLSFGQGFMAPGTGLTANFSVTGDTTITATVVNSGGQIVRNLGTFPVSQGQSSIPWDGRGNGGATLPDGPYNLKLVSTDPSGDTTSAQTMIGLDSTPPAAHLISPSSITPSQSVSFQIADAESGLGSASIMIDGRAAADYGSDFGNPVPSNGQASFVASDHSWRLGIHTWQIRATDNVGNQGTIRGTFRVAVPPAGLQCNPQAANKAALTSDIPKELRQRLHRSFTGESFGAGKVLCHNLRGSGAPGMVALYGCCTITAPTPLGVFEAVAGRWKLKYSLVNRLIYNIKLQGHDLIEKTPVYRRTNPLCCPSHYRLYRLHWTGQRFITIAGRLVRG